MAADSLGVGMLGYAFMGRAHSDAYRRLATLPVPLPLRLELVAIAGRDADAVHTAASRYGYLSATTDWRDLVADERVGLLDNGGPNSLHAEPTIAAARAGKHVLCEKPLGRTAAESFEIWQAVAATGVVHMCAFNYRFVPAIRLARELVQAGELGEIRHFRAAYLQDWLTDPQAPWSWRVDRGASGAGALGDLGSHVADLARFLVGEIEAVGGGVRRFVDERPGGTVDVDDAFHAAVWFESGAVGTLEGTRVAAGRRNALRWEINGSRGSLAFDLQRLNELEVYSVEEGRTLGFRRVLVTDPGHPFAELWWPPGHVLAWGDTFVHELHHLVGAIAGAHAVAPEGADFRDGYRAAEVCDAIQRSSESGRRETVAYRGEI
jgi:predicted dehydrogenase